MVKDAFSFLLLTAGILSVLVSLWGINLTASNVGFISESGIFWNVVLFIALTAAGWISIGSAVANRSSKATR
jgi:hypothetical protein